MGTMGDHCNINSVLSIAILFLSIFPFVVLSHDPSAHDHELNTYVIAIEPPENQITSSDDLESWYMSFLPKTATAGSGENRMVHSYSEVFSGFAARLTTDEVEQMKKKDGFVRAFPDRQVALHTTHTPDFIGLRLRQGLWNATNLGAGVIIGMLDTGISPTHPSFSGDGMPSPPPKWKGNCNFKAGCNKKVIGAKSFLGAGSAKASAPPVDRNGHGTHTASTSSGNFVQGAELFGLANGTASGMAPHAHLAIYQVCDSSCDQSDILAALDAAVKDGVDVLSLSLGSSSSDPFDKDLLAIGAYGAVSKGVIVVCSAGNDGPESKSVINEAPWILTVGASTTDRSLRSTVTLGNGHKIYGETLYQPHDTTNTDKLLPIYLAEDYCGPSSLEGKVKGKVVVCSSFGGSAAEEIGRYVKDAGGAGVVIFDYPNVGYTIHPTANVIPASVVPYQDGSTIISYIKSAGRNATASITLDGTVLGVSPAPVVAPFSSRGPSTATPGILKPDITAPGFDIIAAWPADVSLQGGNASIAEKTFNIISGTSMSCPHISGVAALVKAAHPNWSPAAIKSAIITTSYDVYQDGKPILDHLHRPTNFFDFGAGHVNASRVADPGLVYDLDEGDYISYLCGLLGEPGMRIVVRRRDVSCSKAGNITEAELNYPTISVSPGAGKIVTVNRTVTNVGDADSIYTVEVDVPAALTVHVEPNTLKFTRVNEKKSFVVSVGWSKGATISAGAQGNLKWLSKNHFVRSPIVIPPVVQTS